MREIGKRQTLLVKLYILILFSINSAYCSDWSVDGWCCCGVWWEGEWGLVMVKQWAFPIWIYTWRWHQFLMQRKLNPKSPINIKPSYNFSNHNIKRQRLFAIVYALCIAPGNAWKLSFAFIKIVEWKLWKNN